MKKTFLLFVFQLWGSLLAQHRDFEFFKWNEVSHPNMEPDNSTGQLRTYSKNGYTVSVNFGSTVEVTDNGQTSIIPVQGSLYLDYVNLQEDSTLMLVYFNIPPKNILQSLEVYTWKNGITWHQSMKLGVSLIHTSTAGLITTGYVDKGHVYLYLYDQFSESLYQLKDPTVWSEVSFKSDKCSTSLYRIVADKDYLWVSNSAPDLDSSCAIARRAHIKGFVEGNVFYDTNADGIQYALERGYANIALKVSPSERLLFTDDNGNYTFKAEPGIDYTVSVADSSLFSSIKIEKPRGYIGVKLKDEKPKIVFTLGLPITRCDTTTRGFFWLRNKGVASKEKVVVRLIPQNLKLFKGDLPLPQGEFVFTYPDVHTYDQYEIQWTGFGGRPAGFKTITEFYTNNVLDSIKIDSVQTIVKCSKSPVSYVKSVTPIGLEKEAYTLRKNPLKYLIRFKNTTSRDRINNILIIDTLSSDLDPSTFELLDASHPVSIELSKSGILSFYFNNINLSKDDYNWPPGHVSYRIRPKSEVADNTIVCNKVAIYLDGDKPIFTNSVCNTLVDKMPTWVGVDENLISNAETLYPNPAQDWVQLSKDVKEAIVYNAFGEEVLQSIESKINVIGLSNGMYLVKTIHQNGTINAEKLSIVK